MATHGKFRRRTKTADLFRTTFHRDGTVTIWDVYTQQWVRTAHPLDELLASLSKPEYERVLRHCHITE